MRLEPGPIPYIPPATSDPTADDVTFTSLVNSELGQLPAWEGVLDAILSPDAPPPLLPDDDGAGEYLDSITEGLGGGQTLPSGAVGDAADALQESFTAIAGYDPAPAAAAGDQMQLLNGEQLVDAYSLTPLEAFSPPPDSLGGFDPNEPVPGSNKQTTSIINVTRPGSTDFYVGDVYKIQIAALPVPGGGEGQEGIAIHVWAWQDFVLFPVLEAGTTDKFGFLCLTGVFGFDNVGEWMLTPYGTYPGNNNYSAFETIKWNVLPLPAGEGYPATLAGGAQAIGFDPVLCGGNAPAGSSVTVSLSNERNPGSTVYHPGDTWVLTVTGEPNAAVLVHGQQNGVDLGWENIGTTDADGLFTWSYYVPDATYLGAWVERYQVGGVVWSGSLTFSVVSTT